jgi:hypothetical protein
MLVPDINPKYTPPAVSLATLCSCAGRSFAPDGHRRRIADDDCRSSTRGETTAETVRAGQNAARAPHRAASSPRFA